MEVRLLGAHNLQTRTTHHTCLLVDGVMAVDAGSLASTTSAGEQDQLHAILLTHLHFDHARDLPTLGLATLDTDRTIEVWAEEPTTESVLRHLMDSEIYPDLTKSLNGESPALRSRKVREGDTFSVLDYEISAVRADHPVPTVGYIIGKNGRRVGITGDTAGNLMSFVTHRTPPDVLLVDVTFPERLRWRAERSRHLTPVMLEEELRAAVEAQATLPRIVPVHRSLEHEAEILVELAAVQTRLGIDLEPGVEDMVIT